MDLKSQEEICKEESAVSPKKYFSAQEVSKMTPAERTEYAIITNMVLKTATIIFRLTL